ncbi:YtzH-like family protein [Pseudalkalibacillus caeni]|uniref:YtzH-like protein n=1 Tax=Exobacillus caeni TaxID=2574798 RepID=A0A5R9F7Q1_9BACL|nr:YtzH-like family protein [Pseudalkalibacillus caeni]TLS39061.1 hypothetical protein FCL54_01765 [Pseudalkalibacillus caeni]
MPIDHKHQLMILHDILQNHQIDCCGSTSEYEQLSRLAKALMNNDQMSDQAKAILQEIDSYSSNGTKQPDFNRYINDNQAQLTQWVDSINQLS